MYFYADNTNSSNSAQKPPISLISLASKAVFHLHLSISDWRVFLIHFL